LRLNLSTTMTEDGLTDDKLRLVARHGSGPFERALATVRLAKRHDRVEELREKVEDYGGDATG